MKKIPLLILASLICTAASTQVTIKMKRESGVSTIPCKVNGLNLRFIFDTGASDVSISMTEASFMLKNDYLSKNDITGTSNYLDANGNLSEGVNIILKEVDIGGLKLYNIRASVVKNMKAPLLFGQSAISKLGVVQLDLAQNTLTILNSNERDSIALVDPPEPERLDTTSITMEKESYDLASHLYDDGDYEAAIEKCTEILDNDHKYIKAYFLRGLSYDMLENYTAAIDDYTAIIKVDPVNAVGYCYRGKSKFDLKDYAGALTDLNKGLTIDPNYKLGFKWRAETKTKLKNTIGALADYDRATALGPKDASLYIGRAFLKQTLKDYRGAVQDCNKAIGADPNYAQSYYCRARARRYLKDIHGAVEDLDKAIDIDPASSEAYGERANIKELFYEDYAAALEDYNKAIEIDSGYLWAILSKALLEDKIAKNVWIKVAESSSSEGWYIYNTVISKDGSMIKLWVKNEFRSKTLKVRGKATTYTNGHTLLLIEFNCRDKEFAFHSVHDYDKNGKVIDSYDYADYEIEWKTAAPQTVIDMVLNKVCERYH